MTSERTPEDYLRDILDYAEKAERFLGGVPSAEALGRDERTLLARPVEYVGWNLFHGAGDSMSGGHRRGGETRSSGDTQEVS